MGLNPIPVAFICAGAYIIQALIIGAGAVEVELEVNCSVGGLDFLVDVVECISDASQVVYQFLSFDLVGMPWYIGVPILILCTGSIVWAFLELLRGN